MDAECGPRKRKRRRPKGCVFIILVSFPVTLCIATICLNVFLWVEVKDLRNIVLQKQSTDFQNEAELSSRKYSNDDDFRQGSNLHNTLNDLHNAEQINTFIEKTNNRSRRGANHGLKDLKKRVDKLAAKLSSSDGIGHFEGKYNAKERGCTENKAVQPNGIYIESAKDGKICLWRYAAWMSREAKKLYKLHRPSGRVTVNEKGFYFLYGQLVTNGPGPLIAQSLWINEDSGKDRELARCVESSRLLNKTVPAARTCYFGLPTKLEKGESIYFGLTTDGDSVKLYFTKKTAYFGLIQLAGPNTLRDVV